MTGMKDPFNLCYAVSRFRNGEAAPMKHYCALTSNAPTAQDSADYTRPRCGEPIGLDT